MQKFDSNMRPVTSGSILGIPTPKQWWVGDGPIEPRLLRTSTGHLLVTFNAAMAFEQQSYMDYTIWFDIENNLPVIPYIEGGMLAYCLWHSNIKKKEIIVKIIWIIALGFTCMWLFDNMTGVSMHADDLRTCCALLEYTWKLHLRGYCEKRARWRDLIRTIAQTDKQLELEG